MRHLLLGLGALVLLGGCAGDVPAGHGVVTGGIAPCQAIPIPHSPRYAAGTVDVLAGRVGWRPTGPGSSVTVFPATQVAQTAVPTDGLYRFVLAPGNYVLQAHFPAPANVTPWVEVTVRAGATEHIDIPDMCI